VSQPASFAPFDASYLLQQSRVERKDGPGTPSASVSTEASIVGKQSKPITASIALRRQ